MIFHNGSKEMGLSQISLFFIRPKEQARLAFKHGHVSLKNASHMNWSRNLCMWSGIIVPVQVVLHGPA